jgi:prephenate dehydratase
LFIQRPVLVTGRFVIARERAGPITTEDGVIEPVTGLQVEDRNGELPRVAFQGELGAFSEEAVLTYFRGNAQPLPQRTFADVTSAVREQEAEYGLLPIENTTVGAVTGAYDLLDQPDVHIIGEVICPVRHCLLGVEGSNLAGVRRALSHPVALGQCAKFFLQNPHIEPVATYDTAGAAKQVAALADPAVAAVAGGRAAERYGLSVIAADIHDRADNQTRFLVLSRTDATVNSDMRSAQEMKTAFLLDTRNEPGALVRALLPFAERGLNLSHLESRPGHIAWTYRFFLEIDGTPSSETMHAALEEVRQHAVTLRVLGTFAKSAAHP